MKKNIIERLKGRSFSYYFPIVDLENFIVKLKEKGVTHLDIEHDEDDGRFNFSGHIEREETDSEYKYRIGEEERMKNAKKANDLKIYERIKAEYNL